MHAISNSETNTLDSKRQWTVEEAAEWDANQPWVVGCNFTPSTAINQLEMWQEDTFDLATIDRELGWAASLGMNAVRVYLHDLAYEVDPEGFTQRVDQFLEVAAKHGIRALFVFFDDCWHPEPTLGRQPEPKPGIHNSGWVNSPAKSRRQWPADLPRLEAYVKGILSRFAGDERVYLWDLYNEPGASGFDIGSLDLLKHAFEWAWSVRPSQPITAGIWMDHAVFNEYQAASSDVITFHNYEPTESLIEDIAELRPHGRPVICTEWMARTRGSLVETHLPLLHGERVACFNWGLVAGKTNTHFAWRSEPSHSEPEIWFHDLFRPDGTPFCVREVAKFRELTGRGQG